MAHLSLSLLGLFQATLDGEPIAGFESNKVRALLAYLAVEAHRQPGGHSRQALAELLWPDRPERAALASLRNALGNLRTAIGDRGTKPPFLLISRETIQFNPKSDHWLDVSAFSELVEACKQHAHRRLDLCAPCLDRLRRAVDLYRGGLLEGLLPGGSDAFEEWRLLRQERYHRLALDALRLLSACHERRGEYERALEYARRQLILEPWQEGAHRQVMRVLSTTGQRDAALAQYRVCRDVLQAELGVEPEGKTTRLYHSIRDGKEWLPFSDLLSHNLPSPLTPFVGQEDELAAIKARLHDPTCRLLALVGPGGIGKTRLALEAGRDVLFGDAGFTDRPLPFPQGIYLVPLAHLQSPEAIVPALGEALGLVFYREAVTPSAAPSTASPRRQLLDYLRRRRLLLILDGFEHLLEGAPLIGEILRAAPGVKILVTSRARLNVQGEHVYSVPALKVPEPAAIDASEWDRIRQCSAVELFRTSARRVRPEFQAAEEELQPVVQICWLVQGIPLAILLAAAWMETLSPRQIAAQVADRSLDFLHAEWSDVPGRQRSMRTVLDRSWTLLTREQQETLAQLSIFRGSFSGEAAEQVAGASPSALAGLVRRSLLRRVAAPAPGEIPPAAPGRPAEHSGAGSRYEMHDLLRQYAAEKLEEMPADVQAVRERHTAYYAAALQRWRGDLKSERQQRALAEMEVEIEDVRTAWGWAIRLGQVEQVETMAEGLGLFYDWRTRYPEGEAAFRGAAEGLVQVERTAPRHILARAIALAWQGAFARLLGHGERARQLLRQSIALLDDPGMCGQDVRSTKAFVLLQIGHVLLLSDREESARCYRQSLDVYRTTSDRWATSNAMTALAALVGHIGDYDEAGRLLEESLALQTALGAPRGIADSLMWFGLYKAFGGDIARGNALLQEGIDIFRGIGDLGGAARGLVHLGVLLLWAGQFAKGQASLERGTNIWQELGGDDYLVAAEAYLSFAQMLQGRYHEACHDARHCLDQATKADLRREAGLALYVLGGTYLAQGAFEQAQDSARQSIALYQEAGQQGEMAWARAVEAYAALGLTDRKRAAQSLHTAISIAVRYHVPDALAFALPAVALWQAERNKPVEAIELYALAKSFPIVANARWYEDIAGQQIVSLETTLSVDVVAAAQERGRARDPWATAEELLAELGSKKDASH